MAKARATMNDIQAVAITSGPGSYTGLRIGTSTAKGLCYALDIPLIAVGTLQLLAFEGARHNASNAMLCPMIDARRMEVYCMVADPQLRIVEPVAAMVIDGNSFSELLQQGKMLFFGNGAPKCREVITHANASFVADIYPNAADLGVLADEKYRSGDFEDPGAFKPFYLKEFAAKKPRGS
jgi:tRNA threonylcarbamoyladenosine biosynthesis protein TsaB